MKHKKFEWDKVVLMLNGIEIKGVSTIIYSEDIPEKFEFISDIDELYEMLYDSEKEEDYEYCARIRDRIASLNKTDLL